MGEAGEVFNILGRGSGGLISDVVSLFGDVFGGIASGSVDVVRSIASGAGGIMKDTTSIFTGGIWSILGFINNILIWMAIVTIFRKLSRNGLLKLCQRGCNTHGPLELTPLTKGKDFLSQLPDGCQKARGFSRGDRSVSEPYIFIQKETRF